MPNFFKFIHRSPNISEEHYPQTNPMSIRCPKNGERLQLDAERKCWVGASGGLRYPDMDGIPVLIADDAKAAD